MRRRMDTTPVTFEAFAKAYECILECVEDEFDKRKRRLTADDLKRVVIIHKTLTNRGLHLSRIGDSILTEIVDSLLYEWEESAPPSVTVQQLVSLLSKPIIKSLFSVYDITSNRTYLPELPEIPYEVDDDDGIAVKVVRLVKGNEALGATIKCDTDGRVYIARVIAGGVADRSGNIQVGDRVLEVNNVCVTGMSPNEIVKLLGNENNENSTVTFKLEPAEIPATTAWNESRYVRALIDYSGSRDSLHPCPEAALCFTRGEILELVVTGDEHWWQARSLGHGSFATLPLASAANQLMKRVGLIPSEELQQKHRTLRENEKFRNGNRKSSKTGNEIQIDSLLYESVSLLYPKQSLIRPIVLIGPPGVGRNELKKRLIAVNSDRYATSVPHTSRPQRSYEKDGVDYHFATRDSMEQWIRQGRFLEYGEYKGNLYGTLADSVHAVIKQGRIPVLNTHPLALRVLRSKVFKSFVIFVKPPPFDILKETRRQHRARNFQATDPSHRGGISKLTPVAVRGFTDSEFEQMISAGEQLFQIYGHIFDHVLTNANFEASFEQLRNVVNRLEHEPAWVPSDWVDQ
ncbi:guanylate kinase [Loa loa]|uniref:Guanylate kinase n=1 Tax=Loa loa TaxID=7209 RepID=A0A1I7VXT5_LOALO|nr:guanylate kinase [Loa loa]EFO21515.1 guanylate kinase [Loa loa]